MPTLVNPCTATATQWRDLEKALKAQFELNPLLEEIERLLKRRKRGLGGGGEKLSVLHLATSVQSRGQPFG